MRVTPYEIVIEAFRGIRPAARLLGLDPAQVCRWRRSGLIPAPYQRRVLEAAWRRGIDLTAHDLVCGREEF